MTLAREEWRAWGIRWQDGPSWPNPISGNTLDLHHAWARPGERWAARRSYIAHTGVEGMHCRQTIPEHAIDFVGTGE
jgi:hypothetical protein